MRRVVLLGGFLLLSGCVGDVLEPEPEFFENEPDFFEPDDLEPEVEAYCGPGDTCDFECTDFCNVFCDRTSTCSTSCEAGTCSLGCSNAECDLGCDEGADCWIACSDLSTCEATCEGGGCTFNCDQSTCLFDCPGGGCELYCWEADVCRMPCAGGGCSVFVEGELVEAVIPECSSPAFVLDLGQGAPDVIVLAVSTSEEPIAVRLERASSQHLVLVAEGPASWSIEVGAGARLLSVTLLGAPPVDVEVPAGVALNDLTDLGICAYDPAETDCDPFRAVGLAEDVVGSPVTVFGACADALGFSVIEAG